MDNSSWGLTHACPNHMDHRPHLLVKTQFLLSFQYTNLHESPVTTDDISLVQIMWLSLGFVPTASGDFM